ncbi:SpoIIE family protein phosphatase [Kallotenue papyrolyticum]|uniref:SpoIIE family protein phosphatase n=1 Tax=Kallotenue papyrolyticum TaxID=1325125 RepID=UPI00046F9E8B|nr:SpoIIE family protein phosphatase [Kallotenue papyrolyticum]
MLARIVLLLQPQRSLRARLQLSHLLTSLLPLLILGTALLTTSMRAERRIVEHTQRSVAESLARDIADLLARAEYELLAFGRQAPFGSEQRLPLENAAKEFVLRHYPDVIELAALDLAGNERARVSQDTVFFASELTNRAALPGFRPAAQGLIHRSIVSDSDGSPRLQISVPARNSIGQVVGVVMASLRTDQIVRALATLPPSTGRSAFIIDRHGRVLLGNVPEELRIADSLRAWAADETPISMLRGRDGQPVVAARATIAPSEWAVVIEQPTAIAYVGSRRSAWLIGLALLLTTAGVVVWSLALARELTRPIVQLRDAARALRSGHLGDTISIERDDELGELAAEFNRMSRQLAESQRAIEHRNARLSEGLALAHMVQRELLPHGLPPDAPIVASVVCEAATEIGGDFYSYVMLPDGRFRLIIGDVAGQGVAAALVMALTTSLVDLAAREADTPGTLLARLNAELMPRLSVARLGVALLVVDFDPHRRLIHAANAGMIAPLMVGPQQCAYLPCYGPPLGVTEPVVFGETGTTLPDDHLLVCISDGVVEARDATGTMWGFQRFEEAVCRSASAGPEPLVEQVLAALRHFTGAHAPADDLTIMAAGFAPRKEHPHAPLLVPPAAAHHHK